MKQKWFLLPALFWQISTLALTAEISPSYPIVFVHGFLGFPGEMPFGIKYWGDLADFLQEKGAVVLVAHLTAANDTYTRGRELYEQLQAWGYEKYHLVGHSQGGIDARFVNQNYSDLVASITTINTPHHGTFFADIVYTMVEAFPLISTLIWKVGNLVGCVIQISSIYYLPARNRVNEVITLLYSCSGSVYQEIKRIGNSSSTKSSSLVNRVILENHFSQIKKNYLAMIKYAYESCHEVFSIIKAINCQWHKQNTKKAVQSLTTSALKEFNSHYPEGIKDDKVQGKFYSFGTHTVERTSNWDVLGIGMELLNRWCFKDRKNDGVVSLDSMRFGEWFGELAGPHHFVVANGALGSFRKEHIESFRSNFLTLFKHLSNQKGM